jgi:hypothetical protein
MSTVATSSNGRGRLFEYAVLYHPKATKEQFERSETPKTVIVTNVTTVLAGSEAEVSILAARQIPETYLDKLEDIEITVRPF